MNANTSSVETLKKVFSEISSQIKAELNDEPFTRELLSCVKVHLFRRVKYGTKIPLKESMIQSSLVKE